MDADNDCFSYQRLSRFAAVSLISIAAAILAASIVLFQSHPDRETSMVRVINDTGLPLKNIRINDVPFGDLPIGGTSRYQPLTPAYRYASLRVVVADKEFAWLPADYFGEKPLGKGHFTYSIRRTETAVGPEFDVQNRDSLTD